MHQEESGFNSIRYGIFVCWLSMIICTVVYIPISDMPRIWTLVPFAASVVLFGLPHGAIDHLVPKKMVDFQISKMQVIGMYFALMIVYCIFWFLLPTVGFVSFILLTLIHWGQGDVYSTKTILKAQYIENRIMGILALLLKGSLPMLVPLAFHPDSYRLIAEGVISIFGKNTDSLNLFFTSWFSNLIIYYICVLALAYYVGAFYLTVKKNHDSKPLSYDLTEFGILFMLFSLVDPILAVGVYFCFWHSLRHIVRLIELERFEDSASGFKSLFIESIPMTAVAIIGTIIMGLVFFTNDLGKPIELLSVYLVAIAFMTLPHFVVVTLMDYNQRIW